jgi:hypothetical protein
VPNLTIGNNHQPLIEIADAKGECHEYRIQALDPAGVGPWCRWAVRLTHAETGKVYRVANNVNGWWVCDCPAYRYRRGDGACKHAASVRDIPTLLRLLTTTQREERKATA